MKPAIKITKTFHATATLGLQRHYTDNLITKESVIHEIQTYQEELIKSREVYLSVAVSETLIVLRNQQEPHLYLDFINYPVFAMQPEELQQEVQEMVIHLMEQFNQNRALIEYADETMVLEYSPEIDPGIRG